MSAATGLKVFWLCWLSGPKCDRALFRLVRKLKPRKMMVLGLGDCRRALRLISLAQRYQPADYIHFAGIDLFDTRPVGAPRLPLKEVHKRLRQTRSLINLIPGTPREALMRAANALHGIELIVISADQDAESLAQSWFYLHRLLNPEAVVLREEIGDGRAVLKPIRQADLERLAAAAAPRRRAA